MPAYDSTLFNPPAPLARVTLRNPQTGAVWADVPMLLDYGADATLLPQAAAGLLGTSAAQSRELELIGFDGHRSFAPVVQLDLIFYGKIFQGEFLLIDQSWGIIGRNVLNSLSLLLDGPRLRWDEHKSVKS
jgi:hypothetical protein